MKKILIFVLFCTALTLNAQIGLLQSLGSDSSEEISKNKKQKMTNKYISIEIINGDSLFIMRIPPDKIKSKAVDYILIVQEELEKSRLDYINGNGLKNLDNINSNIIFINIGDENWNTEYYRKEWKVYCEYQNNRKKVDKQTFHQENSIQDSINKILYKEKLISIAREKKLQDSIKQKDLQRKQNIEDSLTAIEKPYLLLERNLNTISDNPNLTIFCGIDVNFANMRLSWYLQDKMRLASKDYKSTTSEIIEKYIPSISTEDEYLTVKYFLKKTKKRPYYMTDDGMCNIITKCEITGSADLIINLFLSYWPQKIKLGGYNQGEIAHFQLMGDRVAIFGISAPNIYKIIISEDNVHFDYYSTFNIK